MDGYHTKTGTELHVIDCKPYHEERVREAHERYRANRAWDDEAAQQLDDQVDVLKQRLDKCIEKMKEEGIQIDN